MAVDYFLKIDGIGGESTDSKHKDEIEVLSFDWGATNSGTVAGGTGSGSGRVAIQDVRFTQQTSKASPLLFLKCANGQHITKAVLTARKAGANQAEFYKVTLEDIIVSSFQQGGSSTENAPTEQVSLNFGKIRVDYYPQKPDGSLDSPVSAGWDIGANKSV